mmetsp:Transcript_43661/g.99100  ORF Transcript_43661/g.99100 Transcript_43661/m.99100 type:complete len:235 (-) Transcript_43661:521-1225(-)
MCLLVSIRSWEMSSVLVPSFKRLQTSSIAHCTMNSSSHASQPLPGPGPKERRVGLPGVVSTSDNPKELGGGELFNHRLARDSDAVSLEAKLAKLKALQAPAGIIVLAPDSSRESGRGQLLSVPSVRRLGCGDASPSDSRFSKHGSKPPLSKDAPDFRLPSSSKKGSSNCMGSRTMTSSLFRYRERGLSAAKAFVTRSSGRSGRTASRRRKKSMNHSTWSSTSMSSDPLHGSPAR